MKKKSNWQKNILDKHRKVMHLLWVEFGESKFFYTSLMQVYQGKDPEMSFKILQEMEEKGI